MYRPRRDGRLSWPGWLTYSGHLTHEVVTCQPGKVRRSNTDVLTTEPRRQRQDVWGVPRKRKQYYICNFTHWNLASRELCSHCFCAAMSTTPGCIFSMCITTKKTAIGAGVVSPEYGYDYFIIFSCVRVKLRLGDKKDKRTKRQTDMSFFLLGGVLH